MKYPKDLIGLICGKLTVISKSNKPSKSSQSYWLCNCDCGNQKTIRRDRFLSGHTKSCGCLYNLHGMTKTPEYRIWASMKTRCLNPNSPNYPRYGGRDIPITVCDRWLNSFENFIDDIGLRPSKKHSIDRIDNDGNYCPSNTKWSDSYQQANNMSTNVLLPFRGKIQTVAQWARETGYSHQTIYYRLKSGWPIEKALTTPTRKMNYRKKEKIS